MNPAEHVDPIALIALLRRAATFARAIFDQGDEETDTQAYLSAPGASLLVEACELVIELRRAASVLEFLETKTVYERLEAALTAVEECEARQDTQQQQAD